MTPKSPLIHLRLSKGDQNGQWDPTKLTRSKDSKTKKDRRKLIHVDVHVRPPAGSNDWFDFDVPEPQNTSTIHPDNRLNQETQVKEAAQLASVLLDTRKIKQGQEVVHTTTDEDTKLAASASTLARADKVRTMLGLKYLYIHRVYEWSEPPHLATYPGVEGLYNPLQILRNRKIRAKYKEYPRQLAYRLLPLPCNAFSSHSTSRKNWKMLWSIDLNELLSDNGWRQDHWHELRNPKGELWFPNSSSSSSTRAPSGRSKGRSRMHDKLFEYDMSDSSKDPKSLQGNTSFTDEDSKHLFLITPARSLHRRRNQIKKQVRRGARKIYLGSSPSMSELGSDIEDLDEEDSQDLNKQFFKRLTLPPTNQVEVDPLDTSPVQKFVLPLIMVELDNEVKKVSIKPLVRVLTETDELTQNSDNDVETTRLTAEDLEACDNDICTTGSKFSHIQAVVNLKLYYMTTLYPELVGRLSGQIQRIIEDDITRLNESTVEIHDNILPTYEMLYNGFNDEIKSVLHQINETHSVRIDNLLSTSDRLIGEVNTSVSHELRKVNDKIDRLNYSFFGGITNGGLRNPDIISMSDSGNKQFLYSVLENTIVITLRIIWVIANILRAGLFIINLLWRAVRLFI